MHRPRTSGGPYFWALAVLPWMGFAMIAVAGGVLRVVLLEPRFGEPAANLIETVGLVLILAGLIRLSVPWLVPRLGRSELRLLGLWWVGLTVIFEFLFGHFVDGASWRALLSNYDISRGRLWILVPLTMGFGPSVVGWWKHRGAAPPRSIGGKPKIA
jgi:branched-subunit amino acid ABC-type transport system permease component